MLALVAACGDPCDDIAGACIVLDVSSDTVTEIDQLELDVLYGGLHGTTATQPAGGGTATLPLTTAVGIDIPGDATIEVGIVAAGKQSGVVLGTGAASTDLEPGGRATLAIVLAPPDVCVASSFYCGGDKLSGDPNTLYQCNGGGVPLARGKCEFGCVITPADDDFCRGGGGTCVAGSDYCGGDKVDGDPSTLYTCSGGVGINPRVCPNGCVIRPGDDDVCR